MTDDDEIDMGSITAVEPRLYRLVHEFNVGIGILPVDSFETAITLDGSYTLHLSDVWAWETIYLTYAANVGTGVEETLAERWSVAPPS